MVAKHIIFIGRVQGVGFRFTAHRMAGRHRLTGYVRNARDGTVEMLAQGAAQDIDDCISEIQEYMAGYLREIEVEEVPPNPTYKDFRITF
ncbi:MAG: acylphosphatase [Planctomycetota bacterium]|jgi:acylphosphatase